MRRFDPARGGLAIVLCLLPLGAIASALQARSETFTARVVAVHDGDTVSVQRGQGTIRVRLEGIDCPEYRQPYSARARQMTSSLVYGKSVIVEGHGRDRYGRLLARLLVDGSDVNETLVRQGMAWHYQVRNPDPRLEDAERAARRARVGLWADPDPVPPWEWRRTHPRR
jgi:endonuclease YncB( thermonuclease family)